MEQHFIEYAPILIILIYFLIQQRIVVTPEQLEKKHREILEDVDTKYATREHVNEVKNDVLDMKEKLDEIYRILIDRRKND